MKPAVPHKTKFGKAMDQIQATARAQGYRSAVERTAFQTGYFFGFADGISGNSIGGKKSPVWTRK